MTPPSGTLWRSLPLFLGILVGLGACQPYVGGDVPTPSRGAVVADPNALKGTSSDQVKSLLGTPARPRRDPPAEIWQYIAGKSCVRDVFMYEEEPNKWLRTAYAQVRAGKQAGAQQQCMQTLFDRRSN